MCPQDPSRDVESPADAQRADTARDADNQDDKDNAQREVGGPKGLEPTRYGDWERKGRCIDF